MLALNTLLTDTLSVLIGAGSLAFYLSAFFYPEVRRQSDTWWSGLGVFYAVVLWFCAGQMTAAILLAQVAAVALVFGLGWQALIVRRQKTPVYQQTPVVITPEVVGNWTKNKLNQLRIAPAEPVPLQLEKRSLSEFSTEGLSARSDPRRRPVYEYEFVEDGIVEETSDLAAALDPQLALDLSLEDESETGEVDYAVPPSAEAEVLSVEVPEPAAVLEVVQAPEAVEAPDLAEIPDPVEVPEAVDVSEAAEAAGSPEPLEPIENVPPEAAIVPDLAPLKAPTTEALRPESTSELNELEDNDLLDESDAADADSWDDDIFSESPQAAAQGTEERAEKPPLIRPTKKPGPLEIPVILIGWIKDVVASFTRPKPSKPVIDIPRREPSIKKTDKTEPEEDNWEESNWDD